MDVNFSAIVRRECKFWSPKECGCGVRLAMKCGRDPNLKRAATK